MISLLPDANLRFQSVLIAIASERDRQEQLKANGKFAHTCADTEITQLECLAVLAEEFGEVAKEVCEGIQNGETDRSKLRTELIQVAAVTVAWLEKLERELALRDESV